MTRQTTMMHENVQGRAVPKLGFGTWQLTGPECARAVADAIGMGYRHIDTARMYDNEEQVGRGIRDGGIDRGELFVTTKLWYDELDDQGVRRATEESLARIGTDYVDLLLVHWPSSDVPLEETMAAMAAVCEQGKTRHIGVSNFTPALVEQAARHATVFCNQVEYHPWLDQDKLLAQAREKGYLLTAYSPLGRGKRHDDPTLAHIARAHGKSVAQVILRWHMQQDRVAAIPKAASAEHRRANLDVFDFELSDDQMRQVKGLGMSERIIDPDWAPDWEG